MSAPTAARPFANIDSHWYGRDGTPWYEIIGKTTGKPRLVNISDARELDLVPGVSTVLKCANKEGLNLYRIEQAVLACVTSPRNEKEELDAYVKRILQVDKVHEEESRIARDKGTDIHDALQALFEGQQPDAAIAPWVMPAFEAIQGRGPVHGTEIILVGDGYAGRADLILGGGGQFELWDFKSAKKLPDPKKGAWPEHRLQLAAYAKAFIKEMPETDKSLSPKVKTANLYISTVDQGKFVICEHDDWIPVWSRGFRPLLEYWQWSNNFESPFSPLYATLPTAQPSAPPPPSRKVRVDVGVRTQVVVAGPVPQAPLPPPMPVKQ